METILVILTPVCAVLALLFAVLTARRVMKFSEGNDLMKKIREALDENRFGAFYERYHTALGELAE